MEQAVNPHLGDKVLHLMKRYGYNYKMLAEKVKCNPGTISKICKTGRVSSSYLLKLIAWHLNTTTDYLTSFTEEQSKSLIVCDKSFCGMKASWAVLRRNQHHSAACKSCDDHLSYFMSRDGESSVMSLPAFAKAHPPKPTVSLEVVPSV